MVIVRNTLAFLISGFCAGGAYFVQMLVLGTIESTDEHSYFDLVVMLALGFLPAALLALAVLGVPAYWILKQLQKDNMLFISLAGFILGAVVATAIGLIDFVNLTLYGINGLVAGLVFSVLRADNIEKYSR